MAASNAKTKLEDARRLLGGSPAPESDAESQSWEDFYERLTGTDLRKCPACKAPLVRYDLKKFLAGGAIAVATDDKGPDP